MRKKKQNLNVDERFWQLLSLAGDGDQCAQTDLQNEYEFIYGVDEAPVSNDAVIRALFDATPENKSRALLILQGNEPESRPAPADGPLLMGMGDSAKFLGVSRATLWRMVKDGRLTKVEIYHNAFRLRREDILALANGKEVSRG